VWTLLVLLVMLGGCSLRPGGEPPPPPPRSGDVLIPGDNLWIAVAGEESLSGLFPVRSDGRVWLELIGGIPAAGLALPVFRENLR
jgi:protein involved in polysaccharide export with SLBB domain